MSLVAAAIVPHSPLLVPNIGKEHTSHFAQTLNASKKIETVFKQAAPEIIITLTSKGPKRIDGFTLNISPSFKANFETFGDLVTDWNYRGEINLAGELRETLEAAEPISLVTDAGLDYASAVALSLVRPLGQITILPITAGDLPLNASVDFGLRVQDYILHSNKRIAIVAAADLSHRLTKQSPLGYSSKAKKFDQKIIEAMKDLNKDSLFELSQTAAEVGCEDMGVLAIFAGLMQDVGGERELTSYEAVFGVGHATLLYRFDDSSSLL